MKRPKNKLWLYLREGPYGYNIDTLIAVWPDGKIAALQEGWFWYRPCYARVIHRFDSNFFGKFPTRAAAIKAMMNYDKKNKPKYVGAI